MCFSRNCPNCNCELIYNKLGQLNWANKKNSLCKSCSSKTVQKKLNVEREKNKLVLKCKFCDKEFKTNNKDREFCSRRCMYDWRKSISHEKRKCLNCGNEFETYKNTTQEYCSNYCAATSEEKRKKISEWASSDKNPRKDPKVIQKIINTKMERYGTLNPNPNPNPNPEKMKQTLMERYGVTSGYFVSSSPTSKLQKKYFKEIKKKYKDAELEYFLKDVKISVDIYIPSLNKIIEIYGDFWHMNPELYKESAMNPVSKRTAKDIWVYDKKRIKQLKKAGYDVQIVWESEI